MPLNEYGESLFAHTSPIYVEVAGVPVFLPEAAKELLEEVKKDREQVEKSALFADDAERAQILGVYEEAMAALERLLKK